MLPDPPIVYLIIPDPIRKTDPPEVAAIKANAALQDFAAHLRARGERITVITAPTGKRGAA